ncbi:Uu.00g111610.m01.CDS01 [Anthostomella pinea]|uniref:Uu.00g111610.m01.CDS01 n=1 Tax=Anthostomella pinea TaxID=933095 RepID=A0AAI8VF51_9PEZI|nr:Uu.00g111610.m01.CDS01 [Anthostomella pinea]
MPRRANRQRRRCSHTETGRLLSAALFLSSQVPQASAAVYPTNNKLYKFDYLSSSAENLGIRRPLTKRENPIPLVITNNCGDTLWPGIGTQNGESPETHGFELASGESANLTVGPTWQGRVWGRTNCTTSGDTASCLTGDCFGKLDCEYGGQVPVTLAEFNLAGGVNGKQCFYDISLVDGYNLPLGIVYIPASNTSDLPPNLVNPSCIGTAGYLQGSSRTGTAYTNSSFPMPYEDGKTNADLADWCPWDLQAFPPTKPGDGVYPYPDDNVQRPIFDPCRSACAANNSPKDCCTGKYNDPNVCGPSQYSKNAKAMCPDAYSYAFDDQTSTFIIPSGGGFEIVFCPEGRSTNILATFSQQLHEIAESGLVSSDVRLKAMSMSYIESIKSAAPALKTPGWTMAVLFAAMAGTSLLLT